MKAKAARSQADEGTRLESALRELGEKEAFNFALFQHNPLAITVVDVNGCVVKSNLARRAAPDTLPPLGGALFAADDNYSIDMQAEVMASIANGRVRECPEVTAGDFVFAFTIAPFPHGAIVIRRDITEHKRAQAQLVQAQKLAALGTLVSGVAHEVSNPNNVMMLSAGALRQLVDAILPVLDAYREEHGDFDLGRQSYGEVRADIPELVGSCVRAAERIHHLVTDLKGYARKDDQPTAESLDVNEVVRGAVSLMGATIRKATDRFTTDYAGGLPPVLGAGRRIEQVIINLVGNACQALPARDCAIAISTRHDRRARRVLICVADEGKGIPAEHLSRITDPFFTTKHDDGGTGLGLSISQQIVENHNGTLSFESRSGRGTTVTVALPAAG